MSTPDPQAGSERPTCRHGVQMGKDCGLCDLGNGFETEATRSMWDVASLDTLCKVCGWTLAASREEGCVPGDCSYRPADGSAEWHRIKARRAALVQPEPQPEEQG